MPFRLDYARACTVLPRLLAAYRAKAYPYFLPQAVPPQANGNMPAVFPTPVDKALFLFHLCYYMRGGILSHVATQRMRDIYHKHPALFDPFAAQTLEPSRITRVLRRHGLGYKAKEIGQHWVENARRLVTRVDGNPLRHFEGVTSYDDACLALQNRAGQGYLGFQEKMVSMLIYFYLDAQLIDPFLFPPPIDFHALRILFAHEIVIPDRYDLPIYRRDMLAEIRALLVRFCNEHDESPLEVCEAMWILSRTLCVLHPGNSAVVDRVRHGRRTTIVMRPVVWSIRNIRRYGRSCARCPVADTCQRCVPQAQYYIAGGIYAALRRTESPQGTLFPNEALAPQSSK